MQLSGAGTTTIPRNTVTIAGRCTSVTIYGNGNHVAVDSSDAVSTSGIGNVGAYFSGAGATTAIAVLCCWAGAAMALIGTAGVRRA